MKHDLSDPHDAARFALSEGLGWPEYRTHAIERGWPLQDAYAAYRKVWCEMIYGSEEKARKGVKGWRE